LKKEPEKAAATADLLAAVTEFGIPAGHLDVPHPFSATSLQAAAYAREVPFTGTR